MGHKFTAKDFRTWAGTLVCASALARAAANVHGKEPRLDHKVRAAISETAEALGNTAAVCRRAYIAPAVINGFEKGHVVAGYFDTVEELINYRGTSLHPVEKALLRFLRG